MFVFFPFCHNFISITFITVKWFLWSHIFIADSVCDSKNNNSIYNDAIDDDKYSQLIINFGIATTILEVFATSHKHFQKWFVNNVTLKWQHFTHSASTFWGLIFFLFKRILTKFYSGVNICKVNVWIEHGSRSVCVCVCFFLEL